MTKKDEAYVLSWNLLFSLFIMSCFILSFGIGLTFGHNLKTYVGYSYVSYGFLLLIMLTTISFFKKEEEYEEFAREND